MRVEESEFPEAIGFEDKSTLDKPVGRFLWSMAEAVSLLKETSSDRRRGIGTLARVITGPKNPPEL